MANQTQNMNALLASIDRSGSVHSSNAQLLVPSVLEATLQLDPQAVTGEVTVRVQFEGMLDTDLVSIVWFGTPGVGTPDVEPIPGSAMGYVDFKVPAAAVIANDGTLVSLVAALVRDDEQWVSEPTEIAVTSTRQTLRPLVLPAPSVSALVANNLNPAAVPQSGQTVSVPVYPDMQVGDEVRVIWTGVSKAGSQVTLAQTVDSRTVLTFSVAKAVVDASSGASASVAYSVARGDSGVEQTSVPVPFKLMNLVDTSNLVLNGMAIRVAANWPRLGGEYPGNSATRTASGGKAPYTYTSSAPMIASVDSKGMVVGLKNGKAVITVVDADKIKAQFNVEVSNVWELLLRNSVSTYDAAVTWMNGQRGVPLNETTILSHYYRWPYPGDINKNQYWVCTQSGCSGNNAKFWNGPDGVLACHGRTVNLRAWCKRAY